MINLKTKITQIHYTRDPQGVLFEILKFCSYFYGAGSRIKNFLYDKGILKPKRVAAYVISVGNMTTGGVGKTPVVAEIAKYLKRFFLYQWDRIPDKWLTGYPRAESWESVGSCSDGIDNDYDGSTDAKDSGCHSR